MAPNLKTKRIVDKAYRRSAQHRHCMVRHPDTGDYCTGTGVVLCHIRIAGNAGTGMKPSDDESLFLCSRHHDEMDDRIVSELGRNLWLVRNVYIPERKAAYRAYKIGTGG